MESKVFSMCKIEKHINHFFKKYLECKDCKSKRGLKGYYDNNHKISNQRKLYYDKNKEKYYRNKMIDIYILKNYLDPMLN